MWPTDFQQGCQDHAKERKNSFFNKWCFDNWKSTLKRMKLIPHEKLKMNQRPKSRVKTLKLLKENIWVNLHNIGFGNGFLDMILKAQQQKTKIDKTEFH